jgi:hypothetical protein
MDTGEKAHSSATTLAFGGRRPGRKSGELSYKMLKLAMASRPVRCWCGTQAWSAGLEPRRIYSSSEDLLRDRPLCR